MKMNVRTLGARSMQTETHLSSFVPEQQLFLVELRTRTSELQSECS